jgi:hypothetical protein
MAKRPSFEEALSMISARRVVQSIRRWSYLGPLPFVALLAVAACGGKVVVDGSGNGEGGAGGTTESSAAVNPSTGTSTANICELAVAHLKSCDPAFGDVPPIPDCTGKTLCQFTCIFNASCGGLDSTDPAAVMALGTCVIACG